MRNFILLYLITMKTIYYIDTGTQAFHICETKEDLKRRCLELFQCWWDHGYIDIYVIENENVWYYIEDREIVFTLEKRLKNIERNWIVKIWEMFFWNKKELNYILDLIK